MLTPGTHVPRVGSAWGLGTDSIPPGPRWVEWELRARWLHCPHIYPLHTFGVPHKTAQVRKGGSITQDTCPSIFQNFLRA